jgi:uncharacterized membrane protein
MKKLQTRLTEILAASELQFDCNKSTLTNNINLSCADNSIATIFMDYTYLKLIHLIAVMIFLGNIITGLFWMRIAVRTKDLKIITFTMKGIRTSDRYFTIPGVIVITAGGFLSAIYGHFPILHKGWILWSIIMFSISGLAFAFKVAPLQKRIYTLTLNKETSTNFDWNNFNKVYLEWEIWGLIALLTPLAAFIMMTLKIPQ